MAGKNASRRNLVTRYETTTACPQARDCRKPGCAKDILWVGSGARMWHRIKVPVCGGCVPSGRHPSRPLARHAPPASLLPLARVPEGLSQELRLVPLHEHAKLKTIRPPKGHVYKRTSNIQNSASYASCC